MKYLIATVTLALCSLNASAALHKWVDENGKVHYSDSVPPEAKATQTVRQIPGKGQVEAPASFSPKTIAEREAEMKKAKLEKQEASQKQAQQESDANTKKRNCAIARENLRTLEESPRIVTYDANGESQYMDDAAREQRMTEARKAVSENCN